VAGEQAAVTRATPPGKPDCPECRGAGIIEAHAGAGVFVQAWCVCVKLTPRMPLRRPPCPRCGYGGGEHGD
jgi:hypothetical protein